jgi:hypothetical protein
MVYNGGGDIMEQQELYKLAQQLSTKEIVYLACSHLEHLKTAEFGGTIDAGDRTFKIVVTCEPKL